MGICLETDRNGTLNWRGKQLEAVILHSRAGVAQQIWIENNQGAILVDCGDGCLRDILAGGFNFDKLTAIIFTHGHFDHMGGLYPLLGYLRMIGRDKILPLVIPENCREIIAIMESFNKVYSDTIPFEINLREITTARDLQIAGISITPYTLIHCGSVKGKGILKPLPAFGYRFTYQDETIAVTGDTGLCKAVELLVKEADLAIIEATLKDSLKVDPEMISGVHLSEDIGHSLGQLARQYVLVHKGRR